MLDNFAFGTSAIAPACALSLSPRALAFGAQGGLGSFGVITAAACTWSATSNASWITLLPGGSCNKVGDVVLCPLGTRKVNFVVATNTGAARSASISVGDQQFQVTQQAPACTFSIQPSHGAFSDTGGNLGVNVYTLPPGMICSWTATSSVPWLTVASGGSGSGTGRIILRAEPNTSGPRTGAATIAGQTFSVTQGGGVCGAHDVTNQVTVFSSGLNWVPGTTYTYVGNYTVSNRPLFPPVEGSLFLVLVGLPKIAPYPDSAGLATATALTYCFSSRGDYILPLGTSLQSGQLVRFNLTIVSQRPDGFLPYSLKFLSGAPNR